MQAQTQHAADRVEELAKALERALAERDEALRTLQQLTSAYADLLASSTSAGAGASAGGAAAGAHGSPGHLGSSASVSAASYTVFAQTQTDLPTHSHSDRLSRVASLEFRDAAVQASEPTGAPETVAMATGVTKQLLEMQSRCEAAFAAERDAVARMHGLQEESDVAKRACMDAEAALEAARLEVEDVRNVLGDRQKLLDEAVREKENAQGAKAKAEERLARIQVLLVPF